jgi:hypothetical protein
MYVEIIDPKNSVSDPRKIQKPSFHVSRPVAVGWASVAAVIR